MMTHSEMVQDCTVDRQRRQVGVVQGYVKLYIGFNLGTDGLCYQGNLSFWFINRTMLNS